jgi:hypothetical protein
LSLRGKKYQAHEENCTMRSLIICTPTKYYWDDQTKDEMDKAYKAKKRHSYSVLIKKPKEEGPLGIPST